MSKKLPEDNTWNGSVTKSYNNFKRNMYTYVGTVCFGLSAIVVAYMTGKVNSNEAEINKLKIKAAVINTKLDTIQKSTERIERRLNGYKADK